MTRHMAPPMARETGRDEPVAVPVPRTLRLQAAERLLAPEQTNRRVAARRFLETAPQFGIDLDLMWGVVEKNAHPDVREVALIVPGAGATGMLFVSTPRPGPAHGHQERVASVGAAIRGVRDGVGHPIDLIQALPEPHEQWTIEACRDAGMTGLGPLGYLRRPTQPADRGDLDRTPAPGFRLLPVSELSARHRRSVLIRVLDRTYIDTRDCPELCGLRQTARILESHEATGVFDPSLWWILGPASDPAADPCGCLLLSRWSEGGDIELVYIGLAPEARRRGLGAGLLRFAIRAAANRGVEAMTCAVDLRNQPATRLYESFGFRSRGSRVPFVLGV